MTICCCVASMYIHAAYASVHHYNRHPNVKFLIVVKISLLTTQVMSPNLSSTMSLLLQTIILKCDWLIKYWDIFVLMLEMNRSLYQLHSPS